MQPTHPMVLQPPPFGQPSLIRSTQISGGTSWYERLRAEIVFQNDLLSMTRAWSQEEWQAKRRLVKVWRRQVDSQIFMAFRAITPEEYPEGEAAVVVSCIFREDKNTCYITSVDIIYLLEAVIGQRFSIEEKNRIRRNLEGFRPQTVSKNKPGSEDFFRTVMAFPDPKPRNIEKDLKVFQWDCLPGAVKKIISKYVSLSFSGLARQYSADFSRRPSIMPVENRSYPKVSRMRITRSERRTRVISLRCPPRSSLSRVRSTLLRCRCRPSCLWSKVTGPTRSHHSSHSSRT